LRPAELFRTGVRTRREVASTNRWLVSLLFLMVLPSLAWPQASAPPPIRQGDEYTIKVNTDSVVLHATVQNHSGILVSGLGKDAFQVYEDGVLQRIEYYSHEDIPVTVGLVVDNSGSMRPKRPEVIAAALAFARSSNPQDQMFVVVFNEHVSFGLPDDALFTDQAVQLQVALSRIDADGMTALYDAEMAALEHLKKGNRDKKVLIVLSDGGDNASQHNLGQVMAMAVRSNAIIYTIDISVPEDPDRNPNALKHLAKATGGEAFLPESVSDVIPVCERISRDIRNQYTLAYGPTNTKQDGAYRAIVVKAGSLARGRLFVRTRAGYYAPLKPIPAPALARSQSDQP
jgi:Ca-activated chloride channel homolog